MNIIKLDSGVKRFHSFNGGVDILVDPLVNRNGVIIVLSEDDMENDNIINKLRGYTINGLLIPRKYRYTYKENKTFIILQPTLISKDWFVSFY